MADWPSISSQRPTLPAQPFLELKSFLKLKSVSGLETGGMLCRLQEAKGPVTSREWGKE